MKRRLSQRDLAIEYQRIGPTINVLDCTSYTRLLSSTSRPLARLRSATSRSCLRSRARWLLRNAAESCDRIDSSLCGTVGYVKIDEDKTDSRQVETRQGVERNDASALKRFVTNAMHERWTCHRLRDSQFLSELFLHLINTRETASLESVPNSSSNDESLCKIYLHKKLS